MRETRLRLLAKLVKDQHSIDVKTLQEQLGVSYPTLRRDLALLASRNVIQRVRGGAVAPDGLHAGLDWFYSDQFHPHHHLKARIGRVAAQLVQPRQTVLVEDSSGTMLEVARGLLHTLAITVYTNSLEIAYLLQAYGRCAAVHLTGGQLISDRYLAGPVAVANIKRLQVDIAFIGSHGFCVSAGITDLDPQAVQVKRAMIHSAKRAVLVADHTKIGKVEQITVEPLTAAHTIVTSAEADPTDIQAIEALGVQVITG
jgi:DeoR/GlpR family transcriptional regulator of sugar metabolism